MIPSLQEHIGNASQPWKNPVVEGVDAGKTFVNPLIDRYWHEEAFIPEISAKEREKESKDVLKAFVYAMGMDIFVRAVNEKI